MCVYKGDTPSWDCESGLNARHPTQGGYDQGRFFTAALLSCTILKLYNPEGEALLALGKVLCGQRLLLLKTMSTALHGFR